MSGRDLSARLRLLEIAVAVVVGVVLMLLVAPEALGATGNDIGQNFGDLLRQYAGQIYGGVVALFSLIFLVNRRYSELGMFLLAAIVVAWMVFSPDSVARAGRSIGSRLFR
ncbi:hypothetical protein AB0L40_05255 [Patulibacter sp. NPDC049589]|uniref:hypothetical protein n=1 Tax=Patulibacter sp. NPDC049589 TaxID=3154731 RepID=UPI003436360F